jgi:hypothetical protein
VATLAAVLLFRTSSSKRPDEPQVNRVDAIQQLKNVLKLGVLESRISQIYEVRRDNLKIRYVPVPWTGQKSVVGVRGTAQIGYDLEKAEFFSDVAAAVEVRLPDPSILSLDLDFHFIQEQDSFLRRLTPDDRNKILEEVKREVRKDLLTDELKNHVEKRVTELSADFGKAYAITVQVKRKTPPS